MTYNNSLQAIFDPLPTFAAENGRARRFVLGRLK